MTELNLIDKLTNIALKQLEQQQKLMAKKSQLLAVLLREGKTEAQACNIINSILADYGLNDNQQGA